ncbi:DUF5333 domain-containing protein [Tropicibacter oceani]|uniref:DUF5333 domain-containing protein n=1 Tax=Tropicibacter oceani TaxID=3058420 RepID=A0ABY8QEV1_9RHOB|nr:DUF5333 domain-containing protein [Tropicibacter oceani]WGW02566.1 DUF5333 domain-containing protein [Tropicibacter oceani]
MRLIPRLAATVTVTTLLLAGPLAAKTPLSQVDEIDNGLMAIAIADEIRNRCDDIGARMIKALATINALKSRAQALGYTDDEIEDYVTSKAEKARMREKATAFLAAQGVNAKDTKALCAFGKQQIAKSTAIGVLLH